jgi:hypothetical protein
MKEFYKWPLLVLKRLGSFFHCSGANYWLGFIPLALVIVTKQPRNALNVTVWAFAIWLVLCIGNLIPERWVVIGSRAEGKSREEKLQLALKELESTKTALDTSLKELWQSKSDLLTQFCYRITDNLHFQGLKNAYWEFVSLNPFDLFQKGETVRIKLHESDRFCAAEAKFSKDGSIDLSIIEKVDTEAHEKLLEVMQAVKTIPSEDVSTALADWMDEHFVLIQDRATDSKSRGAQRIFAKANELPEDRSMWPKLCDLFIKEGFTSAVPNKDGIALTFGRAAA